MRVLKGIFPVSGLVFHPLRKLEIIFDIHHACKGDVSLHKTRQRRQNPMNIHHPFNNTVIHLEAF